MGLCSVIAMIMAGSIATQPISVFEFGPLQEPIKVASADGSMTATLQELTPALMALPGVAGVGEGRCEGKPCIKVFVVEKTEDLATRIHDVARDEPVEIIETGEIRAREELE